MGSWKEEWRTDPARIVVSGSSLLVHIPRWAGDETDTIIASGFTLAITVAAVAARNEEPAYGLIGLVPLVDTDPDLADDPWGDNEGTIGLTPDRLLGDLRTAFEGQHLDCRDHWHSNPCRMPDEVVRVLPRTVIVLATLDILHKSQVEFKDRLQAQGVEVDCLEVVGLHQVKDMDQVIEAGRRVRKFIKEKSIEFVELA